MKQVDYSIGCYIAVDWGTSNFRAYLLDSNGHLLETLESHTGMKDLKPEQFEPFLLNQIKPWLVHADLPIILSGMVGSKQGWFEVPYLDITKIIKELPSAAIKIPSNYSGAVFIIQGASQTPKTEPTLNHFDVMRGEETQIFGFLKNHPDFSGYLCLPGTHSKWVKVTNGACRFFNTFMTGELYNLLISNSTLTSVLSSDLSAISSDKTANKTTEQTEESVFNEDDFMEGVNQALDHPEQLTTSLFSIRAHALLSSSESRHYPSFLSGLLIGQEYSSILRSLDKKEAIVFIATPKLVKLYMIVADKLKLNSKCYSSQDATISGLFSAIEQIGKQR